MTKNPLFSTYRQGENRVTGSLIAVFERIGVDLVERLLSAAAGESSLELVTFASQSARGGQGVPDATMSARFRYLFEVKTERNALAGQGAREQLVRHLDRLDGSYGDERLFVLTPDTTSPSIMDELGDERVVWVGFLDLAQAVEELLEDPTEPASEQERFLLRELLALFEADGLLGSEEVGVVAARFAYSEYLKCHAYVCQPNRTFREMSHLGFYTDKEIKAEIPRIVVKYQDVLFSEREAAQWESSERPFGDRVASVFRQSLSLGGRNEGESFDVYLLTAPDDPETLRLPQPIRHHAPNAWTQHQRYVRLEALQKLPATTDEL